MKEKKIEIWCPTSVSYALLDSGEGRKLERIGSLTIERTEPRAWWRKRLPEAEWEKAIAVYTREERGAWIFKKQIPTEFPIEIADLKANIKLIGTSKHLGIFPEQSGEWTWLAEKIKSAKRPIKVLNLFGYTGLASLAAAKAGAKVTHVDGSKQSIAWARENQKLSGLDSAPIRWICDDALKFIKRESLRGERYDAIIMDPPTFGRGPQGQVWKVKENLTELLSICREVLSTDPLFVILNMYSTELSSLSLGNLLEDLMRDFEGTTRVGELALSHETSPEHLLPLSIFSLWQKD